MKILLIAAALLYAATPLNTADTNTVERVITGYTKTKCEIEKTFDMEPREIKAGMWSVLCKDKRDFIVTVLPDGIVGLVSCEEAKTVGAECWKTFSEQEKKDE